MTTRIRRWLRDDALPLWSDMGVDRGLGFVERLGWDGRPDLLAAKRIRVQARQIYVFSHAAIVGLAPNGVAVATEGVDFLFRHAFPDGVDAGAVASLSRDGTVTDSRRDTYDHAFLLFAFSWYHRATGCPRAGAALVTLLAPIDRLRHPSGEGWSDDDRRAGHRSQNPHMHLLEAMLAAWEATRDDRFLGRANELVRLFRTRMVAGREALHEGYAADWSPLAADDGGHIEPGHHCEWVWLLHWYARAAGTAVPAEAETLFAFAARHGAGGRPPFLCDQLHADGRVRRSNTRAWPQVEAIKARIARANGGAAEIDGLVEGLFDRFLTHPVPGGWIDWTDADGRPIVDTIPASTFYHLFLAFAEVLATRKTPR